MCKLQKQAQNQIKSGPEWTRRMVKHLTHSNWRSSDRSLLFPHSIAPLFFMDTLQYLSPSIPYYSILDGSPQYIFHVTTLQNNRENFPPFLSVLVSESSVQLFSTFPTSLHLHSALVDLQICVVVQCGPTYQVAKRARMCPTVDSYFPLSQCSLSFPFLTAPH